MKGIGSLQPPPCSSEHGHSCKPSLQGFGFLARIYAGKTGGRIDGGGNAEAILLTGKPSTIPISNGRGLRDKGEFSGLSLCGQGLMSRMTGKGFPGTQVPGLVFL
jgi:hypothetical protein